MSRLIDGDALSDKMERLAEFDWNKSTSTTWANAYIEISYMVDNAPTVEPRKGKWIPNDYNAHIRHTFKCSLCGCIMDTFRATSAMNYCPNCGASMVRGEEDG